MDPATLDPRSPHPLAGAARPRGFSTLQVHAGERRDDPHGARVTPIHAAAGFAFDDAAQGRDRFAGDEEGFVYSRVGNPTVAALERRIAALEGGTDAVALGSGHAAIAVALLTIAQAGDHVVSSRAVYEGTRSLLRDETVRFGVETTFVDPADPDAWRRAIRPETRALFAETIANPRGQVLDLPLVAGIAHEAGIPLVVDSTLASPYLLRPIEHGADVVVHSASKLLAGHGTALGGVIVDSSAERAARARELAARLGPVLSPFAAFLLAQGIETLSLRVARQSATALEVAGWLEGRPEVLGVDYAGLASSPDAERAARLLPRGAGVVVTVTLDGGAEAAHAVLDRLELFARMSHLGDVRSLALHPATTSHAKLTADERRALGVSDGALRLSIGVEDPDDLIDDLAQALEALGALAPASDSTSASDSRLGAVTA